ncbi:hypothetical protein ACHAXA_010530 [Cyclostephanos tholiformis]|uniref:Uncharacterized protein n=1 Tax=Cyclostephanos tholiformis TaxID=382380 RepID=A0ABD3SQ98_9STRA
MLTRNPISTQGSAYYELPPIFVHTVQFLKHFFLFFLLPIAAVVLSALVAAALVRMVQRALFARFASPEELLEDALRQLKKTDNSVRSKYGPSAAYRREKALDILRLVIRKRPESIRPYIVLGTELLYRHINGGAGRNERISTHRVKSTYDARLIRRGAQITEAPQLAECKQIIERGLLLDPNNESLLTLQGELRLVNEYGLHGAQTRMIKIGRLDWMDG